MKAIATAAVLMMLSASAWAGDAETTRTNNPANSNEPIVLSEAEMDGVTAGEFSGRSDYQAFINIGIPSSTSGGGIMNYANGTLSLDNSTFSTNK